MLDWLYISCESNVIFMEQFISKPIPQPWRKKLELCQYMVNRGRSIVHSEGKMISTIIMKSFPEPYYPLRIELFYLLDSYLDNKTLNDNKFAKLTTILDLLGYSDKEVDAVLQFLLKLNEEDGIYITKMVESIRACKTLDLIESGCDQDYQGFVRDCLPTKEQKLAVLNYIKGIKLKNIKWFVDDSTIEMVDEYIADKTIRERLIVFLEAEIVL